MAEKPKPGETEAATIQAWKDARVTIIEKEKIGMVDPMRDFLVASITMAGLPPLLGTYHYGLNEIAWPQPESLYSLQAFTIPFAPLFIKDPADLLISVEGHKYSMSVRTPSNPEGIISILNARQIMATSTENLDDTIFNTMKIIQQRMGIYGGVPTSTLDRGTMVSGYDALFFNFYPGCGDLYRYPSSTMNDCITGGIIPQVGRFKKRNVNIQPLSSQAFTAQLQQAFPQSVRIVPPAL